MTTKAAELVTMSPYNLCQKVTLLINSTYELAFTTYCEDAIDNVKFQVKINNKNLHNSSVLRTGQFGSDNITFVANQSLNELCFSETHPTNIMAMSAGGAIDNISLVLISSPGSASSNTSNTTSSNATVSN